MPGDLSERETRKRHIDPLLERWGWKVVSHFEGMILPSEDSVAIEEYPTDYGPVDYALCTGGRILALVEAKRLTLGPQNVLTQAERYSRGLSASPFNFDGYRVPFLYSTNGEVIWFHDARDSRNLSREIQQIHTPDCLEELLAGTNYGCDLPTINYPHSSLARPYQQEAIIAIEQAIGSRQRKMMLAMATGTGKTFTVVNLVYRLMKAGVAKRILFLVDRRALAAQAVQAFASFEAEPGLKFSQIYEVYSQRFHRGDLEEGASFDPSVLPSAYLLKPKQGQAHVYICTIQRMTINLFGRGSMFSNMDDEFDPDEAELVTDIPIHAFDLVVADECHRGYTAEDVSTWRNTLDHFDAIKLGLTATPADHTVAYFGMPTYKYEYSRAVAEDFLVDYQPVLIDSKVRLSGVFLKENELVDIIDHHTGRTMVDRLDDERRYDSSQIERDITVPDSNRKILLELKRFTDAHEDEYGRFPKTLIFAVNDLPHVSHADQLVRMAREIWGRGDGFVQKITGRVDRPLQRIREFRNRLFPGIVVTVDMLSTGVDIPDLENIVLLRPVQSRILFEQMLGRGTRKSYMTPQKSHFKVFDCFNGTILDYFANITGITSEPLAQKARDVIEVIEDVYQNRDRDFNVRCLAKRLLRIDKEMSGDARVAFSEFIPDGNLGKYARELHSRIENDFLVTMAVLRNPVFQNLLFDYPRATRPWMVVASGAQDDVSSHLVIRSGGKTFKPEDYLTAFTRYVQENEDQIEAIRILHNRPKDWSPQVLFQLRDCLRSAPDHFTIDALQKAHELHYQKALVDIISMTKHAVREETPLLTAEERVAKAFDRVIAGRDFTESQTRWLGYIWNHLVQNLSIDRLDFEGMPVFTDRGGWGKANRDFDGGLEDLLHELNEAVAA